MNTCFTTASEKVERRHVTTTNNSAWVGLRVLVFRCRKVPSDSFHENDWHERFAVRHMNSVIFFEWKDFFHTTIDVTFTGKGLLLPVHTASR